DETAVAEVRAQMRAIRVGYQRGARAITPGDQLLAEVAEWPDRGLRDLVRAGNDVPAGREGRHREALRSAPWASVTIHTHSYHLTALPQSTSILDVSGQVVRTSSPSLPRRPGDRS